MSRVLFAALLCAAVLAAFGCGGGDETSSTPDASKPASLVVGTDDLSGSSLANEPAPKMCGPQPIVEKHGGEAAISKMLLLEGAKLVEAVGVFKAPAQAKAAYEALNERRRFECIGRAINTLGSSRSTVPGVETSTPEPLDAGDDGTVVHLVSLEEEPSGQVAGQEPKPVGSSDVISAQVGRCTMALLVAVEGPESVEAVAERTTDAAVERISGVCG